MYPPAFRALIDTRRYPIQSLLYPSYVLFFPSSLSSNYRFSRNLFTFILFSSFFLLFLSFRLCFLFPFYTPAVSKRPLILFAPWMYKVLIHKLSLSLSLSYPLFLGLSLFIYSHLTRGNSCSSKLVSLSASLKPWVRSSIWAALNFVYFDFIPEYYF